MMEEGWEKKRKVCRNGGEMKKNGVGLADC